VKGNYGRLFYNLISTAGLVYGGRGASNLDNCIGDSLKDAHNNNTACVWRLYRRAIFLNGFPLFSCFVYLPPTGKKGEKGRKRDFHFELIASLDFLRD
jgi:hypothetical protein